MHFILKGIPSNKLFDYRNSFQNKMHHKPVFHPVIYLPTIIFCIYDTLTKTCMHAHTKKNLPALTHQAKKKEKHTKTNVEAHKNTRTLNTQKSYKHTKT